MKTYASNRNMGVDLLKVLAILGVIIIHTCSDGLALNVEKDDFTLSLIWRCIAGASVPLFLMASGALMLVPEKEVSPKKIWLKNILRLFLSMFVWALAYKIYYLYNYDELTPETVRKAIGDIFSFDQEFHLYYIHIMLLVYAFLPVTRAFIKQADKKTLNYFLGVWFAFGIFYPTVAMFKPFSYLTGFALQWYMNMTYASIGYGVLGYYLSKYKPHPLFCLISMLSGLGVVMYVTFNLSYFNETLFDHYLSGTNAAMCIYAVGVYGLCMHVGELIKNKKILCKCISYLSKASFCIYLGHVFVIRYFTYIEFTTEFLPAIYSIPIISLCNLLICLVFYFLVSKIPLVNRWFI